MERGREERKEWEQKEERGIMRVGRERRREFGDRGGERNR